ncbi:hypothetical protein [Streptomyces sp. NPDC057381]|uniref:hypothetical protein n=1 Tax=Streptomyces sp. NPDC057381 TaxID=3346111 RepID=UPI00362E854C
MFLAGWWFGQPVRSDGCLEDRTAAGGDAHAASVEPADLGRYLDNAGLELV